MEIAEWIRKCFQKYRIDVIQTPKYQVLLSFPNRDRNNRNKVELFDSNGGVMFTADSQDATIIESRKLWL